MITINATATQLKSVHAFFNLHSISIKPLAMPIDPVPVIANVTIRGWAADDAGKDGPLVFRVEWTSGYTEPLLVDFSSKQYSDSKWEGLGLLDFAVDFGPDQLDWEFCLDDLTVGFKKCNQNGCQEGEKRRVPKHAENIGQEEL